MLFRFFRPPLDGPSRKRIIQTRASICYDTNFLDTQSYFPLDYPIKNGLSTKKQKSANSLLRSFNRDRSNRDGAISQGAKGREGCGEKNNWNRIK